MKQQDALSDISSIKNIMERSTKFISLSGLAGVMAGIYALIGAGIAYKKLYMDSDRTVYLRYDNPVTTQLFVVAMVVLFLSIFTGIWLTMRKARRNRQTVWNPSSRALLINGALPLLTGGLFAMILLSQHHYGIIAPSCLVFYGLALVAGSIYTFGDVKWLGICEIVLGLLAAAFPGYGLAFWTVGFGLLHIVYGTVMHFKYDREGNTK